MANKLYYINYNLKNSESTVYKAFVLHDKVGDFQLLDHKFKFKKRDIDFSLVVNVEALYRHIHDVKRSNHAHFLIPTMNPVWVDDKFYMSCEDKDLQDYKKPLAWAGYDPDFQVFYTKAEFLVFLEDILKEVELEKSRIEIEIYKVSRS